MKTIQLQSLTLTNFKGIKSKTINFGPETFIWGRNATGKTTLVDAFSWLLFGKNSQGDTQFEIKTLDANNNVIPKINHEVEAGITVDGEEISLKRVLQEKWVKRRGSVDSEFSGNETHYFWNDVPMTQRDFNSKVSDLVDEKVFKLITSTTAFNQLKWQDQRNVLLDIAGGVSDDQVLDSMATVSNKDEIGRLTNLLNMNKTLPEYQKQIAASIKKSKEELKMIPTRIDEVERSKPESQDWAKLQSELDAVTEQYKSVDAQISDENKAQVEVFKEKRKIQNTIYELQRNIDDAKHEAKTKASNIFRTRGEKARNIQRELTEVQTDISQYKSKIQRLADDVKSLNDGIHRLKKENDSIRQDWTNRNAESFKMDEDECKCPTCKREFEADDVEAKTKELKTNFLTAQRSDLDHLNSKGKANAKRIEENEGEIKTIQERIAKGEEMLSELEAKEATLQADMETEKNDPDQRKEDEIYQELAGSDGRIPEWQEQIQALKDEAEEIKEPDTSKLKEKKDTLATEIRTLDKCLVARNQIKEADERIKKLMESESVMAQDIANSEKDLFLIEEFGKAKIEKLESKINDRFELVKFKLFETQVNGGEVPTCKALINGVPFSDANTASKINAGIDIINTLCDYYKVRSTIFVDNRESVTKLISTESQVINLIVSPEDETLRVVAKETELAPL